MTYLGTISDSRSGEHGCNRIDGYLLNSGTVQLRATFNGLTGDSFVSLEDWQEMEAIAAFNQAAVRAGYPRLSEALHNSMNHVAA